MRDSDIDFSTVFIAPTDSPIHLLGDQKGTRFALGSRDSSHAAILPVHFLRAAGLDPEKDLKLVRFDTDSRDGKRIYFSNSLYGTWDAQFYPEGIRGWGAKVDALSGGGLKL